MNVSDKVNYIKWAVRCHRPPDDGQFYVEPSEEILRNMCDCLTEYADLLEAQAKAEPVAWVKVPEGEQASDRYPGYSFNCIECLPAGNHDLYIHPRPLPGQILVDETDYNALIADNEKLRAELAEVGSVIKERDSWLYLVGKILETIPVNKVIGASSTIKDSIEYFKNLHEENDRLVKMVAKQALVVDDLFVNTIAVDIEQALAEGFKFGQTYWQQFNSESFGQQIKADETMAKFDEFAANVKSEICSSIAKLGQAVVPDGYTPVKTETLLFLLGESGDFECPKSQYFGDKPPGYWWRKNLRAAMLKGWVA